MLRYALAAGALVLATAAGAQDSGAFSYLYLNASYDRMREREAALVSDGFSLGGSVDLSEYTFLEAGYSSSQTEEFMAGGVAGHIGDEAISAGLGGHLPLSERADLLVSAGWIRVTTRGYEGFAEDPKERREGVTAYLGARYLPLDWLEISGGPGYSVIGREPGWDASLGLGVAAAENLWLDATYWTAEGIDGWSVGLRTTLGGDEESDDDEPAFELDEPS